MTREAMEPSVCERCDKLEAALRAVREAHDENTPHYEALAKIDDIVREALGLS